MKKTFGVVVGLVVGVGLWFAAGSEPQSVAGNPAPANDPAQQIAMNRGIKPTKDGNSIKPLEMAAGTTPKSATSFKVDATSYPVKRYKPLALPNDPNARQWWTTKSGLETAWDVAAGQRQTTVAVIDTGFALSHEEFQGRWAVNGREQGSTTQEAPSGNGRMNCTDRGLPLDKSCNLIDDDNNGYIDDYRGWDFVGNDNEPQAGIVAPAGAHVAHVTNVAGVLAANANNNKGVAGVDWQTKILPLQALGDNDDGTTISVARAVYYAVERGVDVINLSLGSDSEDTYLRQAIDYALDNDVIVVAAAGNDGCNCLSYPARYPEVVAVGAEARSGGRAGFSNYGANLDLIAPGDTMAAPSFSQANQISAYANNLSGTSFAAPVVSGLLSRGRSLQPDATWGELTAGLLARADKASLPAGQSRNDNLGAGPIRPAATLQRLTTPQASTQQTGFDVSEASHPLTSKRVYQCAADEPSGAKLSILAKDGQRRFSINPLEISKSIAGGWTVQRELPVCAGLPTDSVTSRRVIDLNRELFDDTPAAKSAVMVGDEAIRGKKLFVDPSNARSGRPAAITSQSTAVWLGGWSGDVKVAADRQVTAATAQGALTTLVVYNIPKRDCGGYSGGGLADSLAYRNWVRQIAAGIGNRQAIVILEPDAVADFGCLNAAERTSRLDDIRFAVETLRAATKAYVYIDAGHSDWIDAPTMAARLEKAGIRQARGFSLNVSNFQTNANSAEYGNRLSALTGGSKFVVDTSRNGRGPGTDWCNPAGRGLGSKPTTDTAGNVDAYLWIKMPGESDGTCNGGPAAGEWWPAYADGLVSNARY